MKLRSSLTLSTLLVAGLWACAAPLDDARALAKAGKLDQAIAQLETALRAGGADKPAIALELARTQIAAAKLISAQQTLERLMREAPTGANAQAIALLNAQLREAGGNVADALSLYRTIAETTPAVPERAEALAGSIRTAALLANTGMVERSLTEFTESFPQDERTREFLLRLIRQRAATGDNKGAAEAVHRYKAAYPQDPASSAMYEFMYLVAAGDYKGAIPVFQAERKLPNFTLELHARLQRARGAAARPERLPAHRAGRDRIRDADRRPAIADRGHGISPVAEAGGRRGQARPVAPAEAR